MFAANQLQAMTGIIILFSSRQWSVCREVERVHAAVLGAHVRSQCMLPLEMYLEEGIPLVCYLRDQPYAQLVETSEQSCHAFLSFSNATAATPALKVACHPKWQWHIPRLLWCSCHKDGVYYTCLQSCTKTTDSVS